MYNATEIKIPPISDKGRNFVKREMGGNTNTISQSEADVKYEQAVYEDAPVIGEIDTSTFKNEKFEFDKGFDKKKELETMSTALNAVDDSNSNIRIKGNSLNDNSTISQSEADVKYEQAVYEDAPVIGEINTSTFKDEKVEFDKGFDKKKDFKASPLSLCY